MGSAGRIEKGNSISGCRAAHYPGRISQLGFAPARNEIDLAPGPKLQSNWKTRNRNSAGDYRSSSRQEIGIVQFPPTPTPDPTNGAANLSLPPVSLLQIPQLLPLRHGCANNATPCIGRKAWRPLWTTRRGSPKPGGGQRRARAPFNKSASMATVRSAAT